MKIIESKELKELAAEGQIDAAIFASNLISTFLKTGIIVDMPDNYGLKIKEAMSQEIGISELAGAIHSAGIAPARANIDTIMNFVVVGDGDCQKCGGEMIVTDGDYRRTGGDGYLTPFEYETIWEMSKCKHCSCEVWT